MIRMSKLADYGIVLLTHIAAAPQGEPRTARQLADDSRLPLPTVSKILKGFARAGLLVAHRGVRGGYLLSRAPVEISVTDMIGAIDGPLALTECTSSARSACEHERRCPVRSNWQRINDAVVGALESLTLADMTQPLPEREVFPVALTHHRQVVELVRR